MRTAAKGKTTVNYYFELMVVEDAIKGSKYENLRSKGFLTGSNLPSNLTREEVFRRRKFRSSPRNSHAGNAGFYPTHHAASAAAAAIKHTG